MPVSRLNSSLKAVDVNAHPRPSVPAAASDEYGRHSRGCAAPATKRGDRLGPVLKVGVHDDRGAAGRRLQPGRHGEALRLVALACDEPDARIPRCQPCQNVVRARGTRVVDEDQFQRLVLLG
jgi:hypothetical protein